VTLYRDIIGSPRSGSVWRLSSQDPKLRDIKAFFSACPQVPGVSRELSDAERVSEEILAETPNWEKSLCLKAWGEQSILGNWDTMFRVILSPKRIMQLTHYVIEARRLADRIPGSKVVCVEFPDIGRYGQGICRTDFFEFCDGSVEEVGAYEDTIAGIFGGDKHYALLDDDPVELVPEDPNDQAYMETAKWRTASMVTDIYVKVSTADTALISWYGESDVGVSITSSDIDMHQLWMLLGANQRFDMKHRYFRERLYARANSPVSGPYAHFGR
jgi:hypothetical protein